jgi:probable HAF family extracellular repeat protein
VLRSMLPIVVTLVLAVVAAVSASGTASRSGSGQARWVITDLGTLGGRHSSADAINDSGQIVGSSGIKARDTMGYQITHAFLWHQGRMRGLGISPSGFNGNSALAINRRGQIVVESEKVVPVGNTEGTAKAIVWLWQQGRASKLGSFGGKVAVAINDRGEVIEATGRTFLWQNGNTTRLGALRAAVGRGIVVTNERGQIIGARPGKNGLWRAVLWQQGRLTNLGTLGGDGSTASAINEHGQIVGTSDTTLTKYAPHVPLAGRQAARPWHPRRQGERGGRYQRARPRDRRQHEGRR